MRVYRLEQDPDRWQCLHPKGAKYINFFGVPDLLEEGDSRAAGWKPPPVEQIDPDLEPSDFSMPDSGALIVNPRAYAVLRPLLEEAGELLPVLYRGETHYFLHVTRYVDALDMEAVQLNRIGEIKRYAFRPEKLADVGLFKIATVWRDKTPVCDLELFLADGHRDTAHDFRALIKQQKLQGLEFKKVWEEKET
jgi:hypothetical protein